MNKKLFNLQFFAEGGGEGGEGSSETIIYGRPDEVEEEGFANQEPAEPNSDKKSFEELIKGDYKDDYQATLEKHLSQRLKSNNSTLEKYQKGIEPLFQKYGVQDFDGLVDAINSDDSLYYDEAMERGVPPEVLKELKAKDRELEALKSMIQENQTNSVYNQWVQQGDELKELYPSFNLENESKSNPKFVNLLEQGFTVQDAFEALHHKEIMSGAISSVEQESTNRVVDNIKARGMRPASNGMTSKAGVTYKSDPSKFTNEDMADIVKRVKRGETIKL